MKNSSARSCFQPLSPLPVPPARGAEVPAPSGVAAVANILGSGTFGQVVRREIDGQHVAVKMFHAATRDTALQEVAASAAMGAHPCVIQLLDAEVVSWNTGPARNRMHAILAKLRKAGVAGEFDVILLQELPGQWADPMTPSAAAPGHPQPPQLQPRPALRRGLRPRGRVPGAFNQYGSEGPRRRAGRQRVGSPGRKERVEELRVEELVPDPEWVDTDQPADMEAFEFFNPPPKYQWGMAAAHETWAPGVGKPVVKAITYVTANAIGPYILSLQVWRAHAADFFSRLCAHRRYVHTAFEKATEQLRERHGQLKEAIEQLQERHGQLHDRVGVLEARLADAEAGLAAAHTRFKYAGLSAPQEHVGVQRPRERSVPERVLDAQLHAIRARSRSPGHHTREVMGAYLGRDWPDFSQRAPASPTLK